MKQVRRGKRLLAVLLAALLVQPGTAYAVESRQSQESTHVHGKECYQLICGLTEDGGGAAGGKNTGISTPSQAAPGGEGAGAEGHTHTRECYELNCPHEKGTNETGSQDANRRSLMKLPRDPVSTGAETPRFVKNLEDVVIYQGESTFTLEVEAETGDSGTITYEWFYGYSQDDPVFSLAQPGGDTYTGQRTDIEGFNSRCWFYVIATNTVVEGTNQSTATKKSNVIQVTVSDEPRPQAPKTPVFTKDLKDLAVGGGDASFTLEAAATTDDGGTISYNWYAGRDPGDPDSFTPLSGNTGVYTANVSTLNSGNHYFYVVAVNTLTEGGITQKAKKRSSIARVILPGAPAEPVFSKNLADTTVYRGETEFTFQVKAAVRDDGTLTYDWYQGRSESDPGSFTRIAEGDTSGVYTAGSSTLASGGSFFYVKAINTITDAGGNERSAEKRSDIAEVIISPDERPAAPAAPVLDESGIVCASYCQGQAAAALSVQATVTDGGSLSYQWFQAKEGESNGSPVAGATGASFTPPTAQAGVTVYYVVVTNRLNGMETETISRQAKITVKEGSDNNSGSSKNKRSYKTPYEAKKAVEEMLANRYIQLAVLDSSVSKGRLTVLTDFDMTALVKKAEALPDSADGKNLPVLLPTGELNQHFATGSVKEVEYRLVFSRAIWESGELTLELLFDREFLQVIGKMGVDVRVLCVDESGKELSLLILSGSSMAGMEKSKTGLFDPNDSREEIKIVMIYQAPATAFAAAEGFAGGLIGVGTPIN